MPEKEIMAKIAEVGTAGAFASIGGAAHYLYKVANGTKFSMPLFLINIFLAGFVGMVVGCFIEPGAMYRDAIISISGFSAFPILGFMENEGWRYILNTLLRTNNQPEIKKEETK